MRIVKPIPVRLELANGEWVEVKKDLSVGDENDYRTASFGRMSTMGGANAFEINWSAMAFARAEAYLVDWSLKDDRGKSIPFQKSLIRDLDGDSFREIDAAIQAHIDQRDQEKKAPAPSPTLTEASA